MAGHSEAVGKDLGERAQKAVHLLGQMTHAWADDALSKEELGSCAGLAFFDTWRAGVLVNVGKGSGFLIRRLQDSWSAPVFFDVMSGGIGLGSGLQQVEAVIVMSQLEAINKLCEGKTYKWGADLVTHTAGTGTTSNMTYGEVQKLPTGGPNADKAYARSDGIMLLNVGVSGTEIYPDAELNTKLYGTTKLEDVLAGAVPPLPELAPLYKKIQRLAKGVRD